jgi:FMN reductase
MNKPAFSRPPLLIGIGGTTRPGSSTERALAAALAHARTLGAQTQLFGGAELAALPPFNPEVTTRTPQETAFVDACARPTAFCWPRRATTAGCLVW